MCVKVKINYKLIFTLYFLGLCDIIFIIFTLLRTIEDFNSQLYFNTEKEGIFMIRKFDRADIPRVAEIQVFAWRYSERGIYSDESLFKDTTVVKRIEDFEDYTKDSTNSFYTFDDGIIKAFFIAYECPDEDKNINNVANALQLDSIYVDPFFQRQGIGTQIMNYIEEIAHQQNYTEICLGVLEKNENARRFYERIGYTPDGEQSTDEFGAVNLRYVKQI